MSRGQTWLARLLLAGISRLVPRGARATWLEEWHAELWHWHNGRLGVSPGRPTAAALLLRVLGSLPHALWVRRNARRPSSANNDPGHRSRSVGTEALQSWIEDFRRSARSLCKSPGFALAAIFTLALGIGANASMFTVIDAVLIRALPFPEPEELFVLYVANSESGDDTAFSKPNFVDTADRVENLDSIAAFPAMRFSGLVLTGDGEPEELETAYVTGGFFATLDVPMLAGRGFGPGEDEPGANKVVVLSERLWRQRYGADPGIAGREVALEGEAFTVVGVAPAALELPSSDADIWAPLSLISTDSIPHQNRWLRWLIAIGRLRDGVTIDVARDELSAITAGLEQQYPEDNEGWNAAAVMPLKEAIVGDERHGGFAREPEPALYVANAQLSRWRLVLMVRTAGDPRYLANAVVGAIHEVVPEQPIQRVSPMTEVLAETVSRPRFTTLLLGSFAALALTLAAIAIYGVISYTVSRRIHEMGVRVALGAGRADILRMVIVQGVTTALVGAGIGAAAAVALNRFLAAMLYEVSVIDPAIYLSAVAGSLAIAALACAIPARRATRADPVRALQSE
ncbi:MAG: ABC transporter permease [Acidobacteriota bacterium]